MNKKTTYLILCLLFQPTWSMDLPSSDGRSHAQSPLPLAVASPENPEGINYLTSAQQRRNERTQVCIAIGGVCILAIVGIVLIQNHHDDQLDNTPSTNSTLLLEHAINHQSRHQLITKRLRDQRQPLLQKHMATNKSQPSYHKKKR